MPSMDDVYDVDPAQRMRIRTPEVIPPPAQAVKVDALALFTADPAGLQASALDVLNIKIRPVETLEEAGALSKKVSEVVTLTKNIEARRVLIVGPLNKQVTAVNAEAHRWADPLEEWVRRADAPLKAFRRMEEDRRAREEAERQRLIREAAEKQGAAEATGNTAAAEEASREIMRAESAPAVIPLKGFKTEAGSTTFRKVWKVDVVDPSLVPPAFLMPDLPKIHAAVKAGAREIAGCNIFEDEEPVHRTR